MLIDLSFILKNQHIKIQLYLSFKATWYSLNQINEIKSTQILIFY